MARTMHSPLMQSTMNQRAFSSGRDDNSERSDLFSKGGSSKGFDFKQKTDLFGTSGPSSPAGGVRKLLDGIDKLGEINRKHKSNEMEHPDDGSDSLSRMTDSRASRVEDETIDDEIARLEAQLMQLKQQRMQSESDVTKKDCAAEQSVNSNSTKTTETKSSNVAEDYTGLPRPPQVSSPRTIPKSPISSPTGLSPRKWQSPSKSSPRPTVSVSDMRPTEFLGGGSWRNAPGFVPLVAEKRRPDYRRRDEDNETSQLSLVGGRDAQGYGTSRRPRPFSLPEFRTEKSNSQNNLMVEDKRNCKVDDTEKDTADKSSKENEGSKTKSGSGNIGRISGDEDDDSSDSDVDNLRNGLSQERDLEKEIRLKSSASLIGGADKLTSYMSFPTGKPGELVVSLKRSDHGERSLRRSDDGEHRMRSTSKPREATPTQREPARGMRRSNSSGVGLRRQASSGNGLTSLTRYDSSKDGAGQRLTAASKEPVRQIQRTKSSNLAESPLSKVRPAITRSASSKSQGDLRSPSNVQRIAVSSSKFPKFAKNRPEGSEGVSAARVKSKPGNLRREDVSFLNRRPRDVSCNRSVASGDSSKGKKTRKIRATKDDIKRLNKFLAKQETDCDDVDTVGTVETNAAHIMDDGSTSVSTTSGTGRQKLSLPSALRKGRRPNGARPTTPTPAAETPPPPSESESEDSPSKPSWALRKLRTTEKGEMLKKAGVDLAKPISAPRMPVRYDG